MLMHNYHIVTYLINNQHYFFGRYNLKIRSLFSRLNVRKYMQINFWIQNLYKQNIIEKKRKIILEKRISDTGSQVFSENILVDFATLFRPAAANRDGPTVQLSCKNSRAKQKPWSDLLVRLECFLLILLLVRIAHYSARSLLTKKSQQQQQVRCI